MGATIFLRRRRVEPLPGAGDRQPGGRLVTSGASVILKATAALWLVVALAGCHETTHPVVARTSDPVVARTSDPVVARTYWGNKPDTYVLPTSEDTGQAVTTKGGATGLIASGLLTMNAPSSGGAGLYRVFDAGEPITRIGARFTLGSRVRGTTASGAIGLVMMNHDYNPNDPTMRLSVHVYVGATNWGLQSKINGVWSYYATGKFTPPLKIDSTVYTAEIYRVGDTVTIVLPNGQVSATTNSTFAPCNWGYVETAMTAPTDNIPGILENWWDTGEQHPPAPRS